MKRVRPERAMVLAAGLGTRMRPLTDEVPKPLMPLWNRPILGHVFDLLRRWGVRDVLVNLHHEPGAILEWARTNPVPGLRVQFSFEPEILGTGGALKKAAWFFDDAPAWIVNADIAADLDPAPLLRALRRPRTLAALWLRSDRGPRTVDTRGDVIESFSSAQPGSPATATFCGLQLVRPRPLAAFLEENRFATLVEAYKRAQAAGWTVRGVESLRSYWSDLGTPRDYLDAHQEILDAWRRGTPGARLFDPALNPAAARYPDPDRFVALAPDAVVSPAARVEQSVLWSGASAAPLARIRRMVLGRGAPAGGTLDGGAAGVACRAGAFLTNDESALLKSIGWNPQKAAIVPFAPRGSARSFARLAQGARRAILVRYSLERPENALTGSHAVFLAEHGVRVPMRLAEIPVSGFRFQVSANQSRGFSPVQPDTRTLNTETLRGGVQLFEDLGDRCLQDEYPSMTDRQRRRAFEAVLDQMAAFHRCGAEALRRGIELQPPFRDVLYRWEREFFGEQFLSGHLGLPPARVKAVVRELEEAGRRLEPLPGVLLHRDFQSSNILLTPRGPAFIDFQGMRIGPALYDAASLLCDPYVELPPGLQADLLRGYLARGEPGAESEELFWWAAVQRLAQALGAYARLGRVPGAARFRRFIPPALRMMNRALDRLGDPLPRLRTVTAG